MGFTKYLENEELGSRYRKVKQFFFLKESAYDITSACQLRCEGCYYFEGDKYKVRDVRDEGTWKRFFENEKQRGVNYVNLAGAEPSLVPKLLKVAFDTIPLGCIYTNGLRKIQEDIGYKIHISVWGGSEGDPVYRKLANGKIGGFCLPDQLKNYANDSRVVFVYTFNSENIDQVDEVLNAVHNEGHKITFNLFSSPIGHQSRLKIEEMNRIQDKMVEAINKYGSTVLYSFYNIYAHTNGLSLFEKFGCPYPRRSMENNRSFGISKMFRSYRANLSHTEKDSCCVPDTDCFDCRHYAAGSSIVTSKLNFHVSSEQLFRGWLDYVDTYLTIWLVGYHRDDFLFSEKSLHTLMASDRKVLSE